MVKIYALIAAFSVNASLFFFPNAKHVHKIRLNLLYFAHVGSNFQFPN